MLRQFWRREDVGPISSRYFPSMVWSKKWKKDDMKNQSTWYPNHPLFKWLAFSWMTPKSRPKWVVSRAPGPSISGHKDPQHPNKRKSLDLPPTQDAIVANKGLATGIPEPKNLMIWWRLEPWVRGERQGIPIQKNGCSWPKSIPPDGLSSMPSHVWNRAPHNSCIKLNH